MLRAPRLKVRTMMALVAVVFVGLVAVVEWRNHMARDRLLEHQRRRYREVAIHERRILECRHYASVGKPYPRLERIKLFADDRVGWSAPSRGFESWDAERGYHEYWAWRFYDELTGSEELLERFEAKLRLRLP